MVRLSATAEWLVCRFLGVSSDLLWFANWIPCVNEFCRLFFLKTESFLYVVSVGCGSSHAPKDNLNSPLVSTGKVLALQAV